MWELPWIIRWAQCNRKGPYKRETGGSESEREDVRMEAEVREGRCAAPGCDDTATSQGMQAASRSWKRPGNQLSPRASRKDPALRTHFRLLIARIVLF